VNIVRGQLVFYSQRIDGRPFVNCMMYSFTTVLRWMGYDCPPDYGMTLRKASGVPVEPGRGTSTADTKRALNKLLPQAPVVFGGVTDGDLWRLLRNEGGKARNKAVGRVMARMHKLPYHLRRHVGYEWVGGHAIAIAAKRTCNGAAPGHEGHSGVPEVYWMDPMGRIYKGYKGEWVSYAAVQGAFYRNVDGSIKMALGFKNTAQ
jgi:hypothetical protein